MMNSSSRRKMMCCMKSIQAGNFVFFFDLGQFLSEKSMRNIEKDLKRTILKKLFLFF